MSASEVSDDQRAIANAQVATAVVQALASSGVHHVFIAPGARSTPLVVALSSAAREKTAARFSLHVVVDERSAAFAALGVARATDRPAAVVTTSGTAVANLLPAVTEASLDGVPLVVISADRPQGAFERGENQAIAQAQLLATVTRASLDFAPAEGMAPRSVRNAVAMAVARAIGPTAGPVHLNVRFEKPLVNPNALPRDADPAITPVRWHAGEVAATSATLEHLRAQIQASTRGLLVVGRCATERDRLAATLLMQKTGWPTIACATAGLPEPALVGAEVWHTVWPRAAASTPDLVLWLGANLVSERTMQWLAELSPPSVIQIDPRDRGFDPFFATTERVVASVSSVVSKLGDDEIVASALSPLAVKIAEGSKRGRRDISAFDEPSIARAVAASIRAGEALVVGASMPIRDVDCFAEPLVEGARLFANRGGSGIDGVVSTALGIASTGRATTVILGDVSMVHDLSVMALLATMDAPLRVVVVDNRGGGIFSFLPLARAVPETVDPWFRSPPADAMDLARMAEAAGVSSTQFESIDPLREHLARPPKRPEVVVVRVPSTEENLAVHETLRSQIQQAVRDALDVDRGAK